MLARLRRAKVLGCGVDPALGAGSTPHPKTGGHRRRSLASAMGIRNALRKGTIMPDPQEQRSEVARLLAQISREYEAAQLGLSGLAQGISQHRFITRRMERIGELHAQLRSLVGDEAMALITA